jgi:ubiquinol-cytochrome c reductase cytochrome c subunit
VKEEFEEYGFQPAADAAPPARPKTPRRTGQLRRKLGAATILLTALLGMGGAYTVFASSSGAEKAAAAGDDISKGRQLYATSCITCHGANLQGVDGRGPSLLGVGAANVYFQVSTGRMPAAFQGAYQERKTAKFTEDETEQLAAYVQSLGGGVQLPEGWQHEGALRNDAEMGRGGELFRTNCASCHGNTFRGAPLSAGKIAPSLLDATDAEIYSAMLVGPENMPVFSDNQVTPEQKRAIISYVQTLKASNDPGGHGIGRIGPVSEGIVVWVAGIGAIMIIILWIGAKSQ